MSLSVKTMVSCFETLLEPQSCGCCLSSTPGSAHQPASGSPKRGASPGRLKRIDPQTRGRSFCWGAIEAGNEGCKKREESTDHKKREESIDQKKREESTDHKKREESTDQKKREESIDHKKREARGVDGVQAGAPETEAKMDRVLRLRTPPATPGGILKHGGTTMAFSRNIDTTILSLLLFFQGGSGSSMVAIDNKIEQAMDLVKSHLMFTVREEVEVLKEQIKELAERNSVLERENSLLRAIASPEQLNQLQRERGSTIASPEQLNQLQGERGSTIASPEQLNQLWGERGAETPRDSPKSNGNTTSNNNNNNNNNNHNIDSSSSSTAPLV